MRREHGNPIVRTPAALLGSIEAPDEETAIRKAIDEFAVSPALQKRLLARRR
jgi:hypothetical protein